jgi:hypothetical protein
MRKVWQVITTAVAGLGLSLGLPFLGAVLGEKPVFDRLAGS